MVKQTEYVISRRQHPVVFGRFIYSVDAIDSDSNTHAMVKAWDELEIPFDVMMEILAWHSRTLHRLKEGVLVTKFNVHGRLVKKTKLKLNL